MLIYRCSAIRDLLSTEWDPPKREERFMSLKWGNRKLSLNQLHECKSKARWVMYHIDQGDGFFDQGEIIITPCPFLKQLQQLYIWTQLSSNKNDKIWFTHCLDLNSQSNQCKSIEDVLDILRKYEMEHTVRFLVWSSPKGFDGYLFDKVNIFRKKFKRQ